MTEDDTGLLLTRIVIERRIGDDGEDAVSAEFTDAHGEMPTIVEILGLLSLSKDTAIRAAMGESDCDCDDCADKDES